MIRRISVFLSALVAVFVVGCAAIQAANDKPATQTATASSSASFKK